MLLPVFNLDLEIEWYNQLNRKSYKLDKTFGFDYFNSKLLKRVEATIHYISHGVRASLLTTEEKTYLIVRKRLAENAETKSIAESVAGSTTSINNPVLENKINGKRNYLFWLEHQYDQLINDQNWEHWLQTGESHIVHNLRKRWQDQQKFVCYTNAALLEASELLNALMKLYQEAAYALGKMQNGFRIPGSIYTAYQNHVKQFLQVAFQVRQQIAASMAARLQAWDAKQSHVITHMFAQLEQSGAEISNLDSDSPTFYEPLLDHQLTAYHNYIWAVGAKNTREQLSQLSWFKPSALLPTVGRITNKKLQLIPKSLAKDIPTHKCWPQWLFKGEYIRHEFFKDKAVLLIQLKRSPDINNTIIDLQNPKQIRTLLEDIYDQENKIHAALSELDDHKFKSLSTVFQQRTIKFLAGWKEILLKQQEQQIENKMLLAEKIYDAIKSQYRDPL